METTNYTLHSAGLDADLDVIVYGSAGRPVIVLPSWDFTCTNWENNGMLDALYDLVNGGGAQLFCVDSTDASGWYGRSLAASYRQRNVTAYLGFVEDDLLPLVAKVSSADERPLLAGASTGALNATLLLLRHPERYGGLLALSGCYDARTLVDAFDETWEALSPLDVVAKLPARGKALRALRNVPMAFVCGQGADEEGIEGQRAFDALLAERKVEATFEYWGYDVGPAWVWWQEEVRQLLPCLLEPHGLAERRLGRRVSVAEVEADHAAEVLAGCEARLDSLRERLEEATALSAATAERYEREQAVVADHAKEADRLGEIAREAWVERERVAQLLAAAQATGDAAQADADAAAGDLSAAEWICGEAQADAEAAQADEEALRSEVSEAQEAVRRAERARKDAADELLRITDAIEAERRAATTKPAARTKRTQTRKGTSREG